MQETIGIGAILLLNGEELLGESIFYLYQRYTNH
jgi:hypothetical protein